MVVGTASTGCQVAVIGGGPGGYLAAIRLAQLNKDVIVIDERKSMGGVCLNEGCIPSKAMIHAADFMEETKIAKQMGITVSEPELDMTSLMKWKAKIVKKLTGGVRFLTEKNGAQVVMGHANFVSDRRLEVFTNEGPQLVEFEQAIIATGSIPRNLSGFKIDGERVIGSRDALNLTKIPEKLVIIGGGYIGLELGSVFKRYGSDVHLVESNSRLLAYLDKEVGETLHNRLKSLGVNIYLDHQAKSLKKGTPSGVSLEGPDGKTKTIDTEMVMVTIGREPRIKDLGLDNIEIKLDRRGFIEVNNRMETSVPGIYAVGDVVGQPMLAHKAYREAKVAAEVIGGSPAAFDNIVIPGVVYTDPELAVAGLTEKQANADGYNVVTGTFPFKASGRAMTLNAPHGFVKAIGDADTKQLLGVIIMGKGASEMISEASIAIEMGAFLDDLSQTIHPHPTLSEGLLESVEAALGEAIHILNK